MGSNGQFMSHALYQRYRTFKECDHRPDGKGVAHIVGGHQQGLESS